MKDLEIWRNVSMSSSWYRTLDLQNREKTKLIRGNMTFSLTPFERQMNQQLVLEPENDPFRNGMFLLVTAAEETDEEEVESTQALTKDDIDDLVISVIGDPSAIDAVLEKIHSATTLLRIQEELALSEMAPVNVMNKVGAALKVAQGGPEVTEREIVTEDLIRAPVAEKA